MIVRAEELHSLSEWRFTAGRGAGGLTVDFTGRNAESLGTTCSGAELPVSSVRQSQSRLGNYCRGGSPVEGPSFSEVSGRNRGGPCAVEAPSPVQQSPICQRRDAEAVLTAGCS